MIFEENISDNEIRFLGEFPKPTKKPFPWRLFAVIATSALLCGIIIMALVYHLKKETMVEQRLVLQSASALQLRPDQPHPLQEWFLSLDSLSESTIVNKDTVVNDIPLHIYVPLNSTPHLEVGRKIANNPETALMFFEAADVRADNGKIVGAFVLKGEPMSRGLSKRGYCAIIDNVVTVGVAENSPLFEEATEKNGDFFRQYPLVDEGNLVENELKNKSIRRALCDIDNHIAVVETQSRESLHDFAQALIDIGTSNAIYLVGGDAMGWSIDEDGNGYEIGNWSNRKHKNISFIVWSK